jgi:hypothetical protein
VYVLIELGCNWCKIMRVTYLQFQEDISDRIRDLIGHDNDRDFVYTLRNYVTGLVKFHGASEAAAMQRKLYEFLEDSTPNFVNWYASNRMWLCKRAFMVQEQTFLVPGACANNG